jgi:hypothetical protein
MNRYFLVIPGTICIACVLCAGEPSDTSASVNQKKRYDLTNVKSQLKKSEEKKPMTTDVQLPLGITEKMPLNEVKLVYGFYSAKTGAGRQEITLLADGTVTLFNSRSYNDPHPKIMEAKCSGDQILRLFDLLEGMGFYGLPDEYSSNDHPHARRLLKFSMPGREKVVAVDEPGNYAIEQCIGAIKLCAGLCIPEAINQRFFPNL